MLFYFAMEVCKSCSLVVTLEADINANIAMFRQYSADLFKLVNPVNKQKENRQTAHPGSLKNPLSWLSGI